MLAIDPNREKRLSHQAWDLSQGFHDNESVHLDTALKSFGESRVHTVVVGTLLNLLYRLSNESLGESSHESLALILETPAWDEVLPRLKDVLIMIDSKMVQAIAEGLLKESIHARNHRMLDLALGLGADTTRRIKYSNLHHPVLGGRRHVLYTPLVALCDEGTRRLQKEDCKPGSERLILSLLRKDPRVPNSSLLWLIRAGCYSIAERLICSKPELEVDFAIAASDLEGGSWLGFNTYDPITPLLVACSDWRKSAEKLSLIRCLLERNADANLEAMIAAAGTCDVEVISLLRQHGAPVNGSIQNLGSPLSSACMVTHFRTLRHYALLDTLSLLLRMGASPSESENRRFNGWVSSPLHILALAEDHPVVEEALDLVIKNSPHINHSARLYDLNRFRCEMVHVYSGRYRRFAETALEHAITFSRWISATKLILAGSKLTGREILFVETSTYCQELPATISQERFRIFIDTLLTKAPDQAAAMHWSGLTVLQRAIQNENEDLILALFRIGTQPMSLDFLYMLSKRKHKRARVSTLSCSTQMKLALAAKVCETPISDISTIRLILAFSCPEVVRYVLNCCPLAYDSEGLCFVIARVVSKDIIRYFDGAFIGDTGDDQRDNSLTMGDFRAFISRRTSSNRDEDWESTAVTMAARAGHSDMLYSLTGSSGDYSQNSGMIPQFLIKEFLICDSSTYAPFGMDPNELNWGRLGVWIKYCRMDNPVMRCSPLTAAALIVPAKAAEEMVDLLLALDYQPDSWTVLVASCQGRLSILERLKGLECWSHLLSHEDRPEWCPTALQSAAYSNHVDVVNFLLRAGAMIESTDLPPCRPFCFAPPSELNAHLSYTKLPRTALQHAVENENMELVTLLVNAGAKVNAPAAMDSGATALQIASIQGCIPMVQYLISHGADPYAKGAAKHGRTALQGAAEHGRKDIVDLLLANSASAYQHREELVKAVFYSEKNTHKVVTEVLREGLSPRWTLEDQETIEMLSEDWESSSENSVFNEILGEFEAWNKKFEHSSEPELISEDQHALQTLSKDCESRSEHSTSYESEAEVHALEDTFTDNPESLLSHESNPNSGARTEEPLIENPISLLQDDSWFLQELQLGIDGYGELDVGQSGEFDLYDGDLIPQFPLQEDNAASIEDQSGFEGYDAGDIDFLLGPFY